MAKKRKTKKNSKVNLFEDDRIPKLAALISLLTATYLLIAFISYFFTWQSDQHVVLNSAMEVLGRGDLVVNNWLGRLGALVSHGFFYGMFGLASMGFIYIFILLATNTIKKKNIKSYGHSILSILLSILSLSIILSLLFGQFQFPFGGWIGDSIAMWLVNFLGKIGTGLLLVVATLSIFIWNYDPNIDDVNGKNSFATFKNFIRDFISGDYQKRKRKTAQNKAPFNANVDLDLDEISDNRTSLKPRTPEEKERDERLYEIERKEKEDNFGPIKQGEQMSFDIPKKTSTQAESIGVGSEMEINIAAEGAPTDHNNTYSDINQITSDDNLSNDYDPTLDLSGFKSPPINLLPDYMEQKVEVDKVELNRNKDQIIETLMHYKIEIIKIRATVGPTVTLYEIIPKAGVRISKIKNLEDDIALSLSALGIRIIAPIPGKGTIGIEVPNKQKQIVSLNEIIKSDKFQNTKMTLPIALGKTISNEVFVADLAKMPHLLIAGATGQGKSVGINSIITSLLYKKHPSQLKLILVDPKKVELFPYNGLKNHFLAFLPGQEEAILTDTKKVVHTLNSLILEMEDRYDLLKVAKARNIKEYNKKFITRNLNPQNGHRFLPFLVLIIDEFADLIMTAGKEIETPIARLAQLSRAVGIHIIIATQRPSVNIITGIIKANFPARIAFKVTAKVDSRTILDTGGADRLVGRGDMLLAFGSEVHRLQCAFIDTPELEKVIDYISDQKGYPVPFFLPEYHGDDEEDSGSGTFKISDLDALFWEAAKLVVANQHGSTSMIQRKLKLGYNRAGRIMDQMEALGIVGPARGSKPREVLMYDEIELERFLNDIKARK